MIIVVAPCRNQLSGMAQSFEEVLVQAFVTHAAIEAFHKTVLHWFSWCDVMPLNFPVFLPFQDHIQYAKAPPAGQAVKHEVQGPPLVRSLRDRHGCSGAQGTLSAPSLAHSQFLFFVDAVQLLPVHNPSFPFEQDMQATVSKPTAFR